MACGPDCKQLRSEQYDAYYCETCNEWLEDACDDPTCEYCTNRPKLPVNEIDV